MIEEWWLDAGKKDDLLEANTTVLDAWCDRELHGAVDAASSVQGRVQIGAGTVVENSRVRGPVVIGEKCTIRNSFVGPFTSIGHGTVVLDSVIEHSVLMRGCRIHGVDRIEDSLLGNDVVVESSGSQQLLRMSLGDDSHVEL